MHQKLIWVSGLFLVTAVFSAYVLYTHNTDRIGRDRVVATSTASSTILYYGRECPHCQLVEKFIADNKIGTKIPIAQKEVYHDTANAADLRTKAAVCGLKTDSIGVPFLWTGSTCIIGEQEVISFLTTAAAGK